ncbi:hypothetical protein Tco_1175874 [Tanacetum coccineum]
MHRNKGRPRVVHDDFQERGTVNRVASDGTDTQYVGSSSIELEGGSAAPLLARDTKTELGGFTYVKEVVKIRKEKSKFLLGATVSPESSEKDRKLHLSMYGKAAQLEKQMGAKLAWLREKYSYRTCEGIGYSSSQANCYLIEKELHQLRMDERTLEKTFAKRGHEQMATRERK